MPSPETKNRYDKERLLQDADMESVAQFIGIETKRMGKNISILCPNPQHNDRKPGNCFIRPGNTYTCYACGSHGNVFKMVMEHEGVSFPEALGIVGDACGGRRHYHVEGGASQQEYRKILGKEECELIGIYNERVYGAVRMTYDPNKLQPGERAVLIDLDVKEEAVYMVERCLEPNPLKQLMQDDLAAYKELIVNKANETVSDCYDVIVTLSQIADGTFFAEFYKQKIARIQDLLINHFKEDLTDNRSNEVRRTLRQTQVELLARQINRKLVEAPF